MISISGITGRFRCRAYTRAPRLDARLKRRPTDYSIERPVGVRPLIDLRVRVHDHPPSWSAGPRRGTGGSCFGGRPTAEAIRHGDGGLREDLTPCLQRADVPHPAREGWGGATDSNHPAETWVGAIGKVIRSRDRGGAPRQPPPQWRYSHAPLYGKMLKMDGGPFRLPDTAFHRLSPHTAPAPGGGGGAPEARAGWELQISWIGRDRGMLHALSDGEDIAPTMPDVRACVSRAVIAPPHSPYFSTSAPVTSSAAHDRRDTAGAEPALRIPPRLREDVIIGGRVTLSHNCTGESFHREEDAADPADARRPGGKRPRVDGRRYIR